MSAEGYYANRNSPKPPWVSTIELTPAGGGKKGEVVQGSYKGKCSCNKLCYGRKGQGRGDTRSDRKRYRCALPRTFPSPCQSL